MALLHGLWTAGYRQLVVCHLNHGLRGEAAATDAGFVRRLADGYELPVEIGLTDVPTLAREQKRSLEAAAREARYRFFAGVAGRRRCRTLVLAHHADDQAETFLFNLLRGAGPAGLAGMSGDTTRQIGRCSLRIVRPLLAVWRGEVDAYVRLHGLEWREDATNADPAASTRNRLRAEVLPLLERAMGRPVKETLWRTADILRAEEAWWEMLRAGDSPPADKLPVQVLRSQPLAAQRRTVLQWLSSHGVTGVGYLEVENVLSLLETGGPAKVNLPGGRFARRRAGRLFIE